MSSSEITIFLKPQLIKGTDASCEKFKKEINKLFETWDSIMITNKGWIPSQTTTITKESWRKLWEDET